MSPEELARPFDVAIAGAGLAGASLATRLARDGARIVVLDQGRFPRDKLCGEFLSPECWEVLDRHGLARELDALGYHPIRRVRLTTPRGRAIEADFTTQNGRPGLGLSRSALDEQMVRRARAAGALVIEGARVVGPLVRDGRVIGLKARHLAWGPLEVCAAVVVAADGRLSGLVRGTGVTRPRSLFRPGLFGLKCHLDRPDERINPPGTVVLHLLPGGYVGTCRVEGAWTNLCGLLPEATLRRHRGQLDRLAAEQFRGNPALARLWGDGAPASAWKAVAGVRVETSTPTLAGIFYTGDCQGTVDPLGGQGMTMALLGAEVLAPFLAAALADGEVGPRRQRAYEAAWNTRFGRRIRLCRTFHHLLVHPLLIDLASALPTLASALLRSGFQRTRDPGAIRASPLTANPSRAYDVG